MEENNTHTDNYLGYVRTTVYLPRNLHREAKFKAALADTSVSNLVIISLKRTLKEMMERK